MCPLRHTERVSGVALAKLTGFGLGSRLVGSTECTANGLSLVCEVCFRCQGEGFKLATLIAGKWVGGDTEYLCSRCRGAGAVTYVLFPDQQESLAAKLLLRIRETCLAQ